LHAYSFAIVSTFGTTKGDLLIYGAFERFANNGAGDLGYWLLQDSNVGCSSTKGAVSFNGTHTVGDILLVGEFSIGGAVTTLSGFKWVGGTNQLMPLFNVTSTADCQTAPPGAAFCSRSNTAAQSPISTPWLTQDKTSTPNQLATAEFLKWE